MALIDILAAAQGGQYFSNAGHASGVSEAAARHAFSVIGPAIAERLRDKAETNQDSFEKLVDLLEDDDGSFDLDDPNSVLGAEAVADGEAILRDLYGGVPAARAAFAKLNPGIDGASLDQLASLAATSVLASLTTSYRTPQTLAGAQPVASSEGGGGLLGQIVSALVEGAVKGVSKQLAPKRRRRRSYASYWNAPRKRRTTRRKRTRNPSLNDIFGAILGRR